ncbi:hypothetical protein RRG08_055612 [Elysia crispata]|uniref:Uncharacterized protein n=1 Tax=Elysia crispata TaxID=231223 RepID=A0AAE0YCV4_9GAST|nr:hypothetical protein RRG08_055612 [Elysia crispata]
MYFHCRIVTVLPYHNLPLHCRIVTRCPTYLPQSTSSLSNIDQVLPIYHNLPLHCRIVDQVLPIYHNLPLHCRTVTKFYLSTTIYLFTVE